MTSPDAIYASRHSSVSATAYSHPTVPPSGSQHSSTSHSSASPTAYIDSSVPPTAYDQSWVSFPASHNATAYSYSTVSPPASLHQQSLSPAVYSSLSPNVYHHGLAASGHSMVPSPAQRHSSVSPPVSHRSPVSPPASPHKKKNVSYKRRGKNIIRKCIKESCQRITDESCVAVLAVVIAVLVLGLIVACTVFALEFTKLQSEITLVTSLQQDVNTLSDGLDGVTEQAIQDCSQFALSSIISQQQLSGDISALNLAVERRSQSFPVPSCAALPLPTPSGYYWVRASNGSAVRVYCDMTRSCGRITGGWTRLAQLNFTNSSQQCPSGFKQRNDSNISTCVRESDQGGCSSIVVSPPHTNYTRVCGRVIAYQIGSPGAFRSISVNIDSEYVVGVSLTHGSPREHIWTFAAAREEVGIGGLAASCPCISGSNQASSRIPSYVGENYFCDTGSRERSQSGVFYSADPLWDGAGCGPPNTCCSFNNPPWFYRLLPQTTTDDIEMRVCRIDSNINEDIAIELVDIYVR